MVHLARIVGVVLAVSTESVALAGQNAATCSLCASQLASIRADLDHRPETGAKALITALAGTDEGDVLPAGLSQTDAKAYFEVLFHPEFLNRLVSKDPETIARWDAAVNVLEALYAPTNQVALGN